MNEDYNRDDGLAPDPYQDLTMFGAFPGTSPVEAAVYQTPHDSLGAPHNADPAVLLWDDEPACPPPDAPDTAPYPTDVVTDKYTPPAWQRPHIYTDDFYPGQATSRYDGPPAVVPAAAHASQIAPAGLGAEPFTPPSMASPPKKQRSRPKPSTPLLQHKYAPLGEIAPAGWGLSRPDDGKKRKAPSKTKKRGKSRPAKAAKTGTVALPSALSLLPPDPIPRISSLPTTPSKSKKAPSIPKSAGAMPQRCSYEHCANPLHTSGGSWKLVSADTRAGGQDWSMYIGRLFCNACFTQHATKGSMQRLGKQLIPTPAVHPEIPPLGTTSKGTGAVLSSSKGTGAVLSSPPRARKKSSKARARGGAVGGGGHQMLVAAGV